MRLTNFKNIDFLQAIKELFEGLNIPMNYVADEPTSAQEILEYTYKDNSTFKLINDVYFVGMVDDAAFKQQESISVSQIASDYDGILVFGITLAPRDKGLLPTRSQLAEVSRAFNREFYYTPVVIVFKYANNNSQYIAFANTERLQYMQAWREGEKTGKVSLLRDIDIQKPHRGHEDIINELIIPTKGNKAVDSFDKLYKYWQGVFNVSLLSKKFYKDLSNWYFWAIKHVSFPNAPVSYKETYTNEERDKIHKHNAQNVIRMLTRLLFTWFIKEKRLIPENLFELDTLQRDILNKISPLHEENTLFAQGSLESVYYKAILQNLFFATLNCPIEPEGKGDNRKRGFRGKGTTGYGVTYLMRYEKYFKDKEKFLSLVNETVPFLNGGLFECLDIRGEKEKADKRVWIDGFSDNLPKEHRLIVPDYLFFGVEEKVDLSADYGVKNKGTKQAAVKGLINILKSYKFTITENTPIEEDVALDPELLGKVFENLLASYNPETKTTARKQTGSFYTPREIVNYMVDESLINYLKNNISNWLGLNEEQVDNDLHTLVAFDNPVNPFADKPALQKDIIKALDACKILDPACGSGAFPMGILQKMVHILHKVDPNNTEWKQRQIERVDNAIEQLELMGEMEFSNRGIKELEQQKADIEEAFTNNELDYGRKLYLIENCIYGVDIQSIATQISKLRFFISLVVDQKIEPEKVNFGVRPLPNLETKFVTANTLIDIDKPKVGDFTGSLFDNAEVKKLEEQLKKVRHKLFSARTPATKRKLREQDKEVRNQIASQLADSGWQNDTARQLASWDPYDQNASSSFFNIKWMFDISEGFDIVIGNPPYGAKFDSSEKKYFSDNYNHQDYQPESYLLFMECGIRILKKGAVLSYIIPNTWITNLKFKKIRKHLFTENTLKNISHYHNSVFDAVVDTEVVILSKGYTANNYIHIHNHLTKNNIVVNSHEQTKWQHKCEEPINIFLNQNEERIIEIINNKSNNLDNYCNIVVGMKPYQKGKGTPKQTAKTVSERIFDSDTQIDSSYKPLLRGSDINKYELYWQGDRWIKYGKWLAEPRESANFDAPEKIVLRQTGDSLIANLDTKGFVCMNNLHVITPKTDYNLRFILAIINSSLMNFYYQALNPEVGEALAEVKKENVSRLKIIYDNRFVVVLELLVNMLLFSNEKKKHLLKVVDALVFNLYFTDHMKDKEIDVIKYVEQDLKDVLQLNDFEQLHPEIQGKMIEALHKKWTHPDNEVRNRIKLFSVRSPKILKPIIES